MAQTIDKPDQSRSELLGEINNLVNENRQRCLWSMRKDYLPATDSERFTVLRYLATYGDRATFVRARNLRDCLQQITNEPSAE